MTRSRFFNQNEIVTVLPGWTQSGVSVSFQFVSVQQTVFPHRQCHHSTEALLKAADAGQLQHLHSEHITSINHITDSTESSLLLYLYIHLYIKNVPNFLP